MRWIRRIGPALALAVGVAGCGDEGATNVGSDLIGEGLRTVQVVYDASEFLQGDTVYDRIATLNSATFGIVANEYGGNLDAHVLFEVFRPLLVNYEDTTGTAVRDTIRAVRGGTLTVVIDSLTPQEGPVEFEVVDVTESWDRESVSWTLRTDTAGVTEPWTTPGGTPGEIVATATWESGDTLLIPLDSAAASIWDDTTTAANGGMLRLATPGTRLRLRAVTFEFDVTPTGRDTVVTAGRLSNTVPIAPEPPAPGAGVVRVGGLPVWRSLLHFRRLDDLMVPCEQGSTTCSIPLSEVTVSNANLLLWTESMDGYRSERDMRVEGRAVLEGPTVPLTRSPLSGPFSQTGDVVALGAFEAPARVMTRVPITGFVQRNSNTGTDEEPLLWLALTAVAERAVFGYGEFGSLGSAMPPQLEIVATIPVKKVTP